ncbi:hypothetical protein BDQ17DRAFT_1428213 [Cyathus striatus]|nr:hypothetical protein BDQ17DRAFT_1428213 [Cyathus striatus]
MLWLLASFTLLPGLVFASMYELAQNTSGDNFFRHCNFVDNAGVDSVLDGYQSYVNSAFAEEHSLAYVDDATGHTIMKVDNTTNIPTITGGPRNSIRIISQAAYSMGSVWIIDLFHAPYGCGVQPAFWSMAPTQVGGTLDGFIRTFETENKGVSSIMRLRTAGECNAPSSNPNQNASSIVNATDCNATCMTTNAGFISYAREFNNGGGGVYITEFASTGISIWSFPRSNIPHSILNTKTINTTALGTPVANWAASICGGSDGFHQNFLPQSLVIEIMLCGDLSYYLFNQTCPPGFCENYVLGNGSQFGEAYFEIGSVQVFNQSIDTTSSTSASNNATATATSGTRGGSKANKHKGTTIEIVISVICGFLIIMAVALLVYKRRKNTSNSKGDPVPFFSTQQGNINVVHNPMHMPPRPKSPNIEMAADLNTAEEKRPSSLTATAGPAPAETTELLEELDMLRRRLAEVTESVAGDTPPPTYYSESNDENAD